MSWQESPAPYTPSMTEFRRRSSFPETRKNFPRSCGSRRLMGFRSYRGEAEQRSVSEAFLQRSIWLLGSRD